MAPKLINQILSKVSKSVLSAETGLSHYQIGKLQRGSYGAAQRKELNQKLRAYREESTYQIALATGKRQTAREIPLVEEKPVRKLSTPLAVERDLETRASEIKKLFPRLTRGEIIGSLERDAYTRKKLAEALDAYRTAKQKAVDDYRRYRVKRQNLDDYIRSKTGKEYKALSKAFDQRKKTEQQRTVKKLITSEVIDVTIENYGRGRGQWHSLKRL